jgi:hypothetical protein
VHCERNRRDSRGNSEGIQREFRVKRECIRGGNQRFPSENEMRTSCFQRRFRGKNAISLLRLTAMIIPFAVEGGRFS